MFFFFVGEAATSKWTNGEVAAFGSTVYKIFALKCQKLRTPLASLAPCVKICHTFFTFSEKNVFTVRKCMWKIVHQHCSSLMITLIKISNFVNSK